MIMYLYPMSLCMKNEVNICENLLNESHTVCIFTDRDIVVFGEVYVQSYVVVDDQLFSF